MDGLPVFPSSLRSVMQMKYAGVKSRDVRWAEINQTCVVFMAEKQVKITLDRICVYCFLE